MESANKQWEERTAMLKQELASGQSGGGSGGGGGVRGGGGGGGGAAALPMSGDAGPWQEALLRSASFAAAQQAELALQQEICSNWPRSSVRARPIGRSAAAGCSSPPRPRPVSSTVSGTTPRRSDPLSYSTGR